MKVDPPRRSLMRLTVLLRLLGVLFLSGIACNQLTQVVVTVVPITVEPKIVTVEVPIEVTRILTKKRIETQVVTREVVVVQTVEVEVTRLVPLLPPQPTPPPVVLPTPTERLFASEPHLDLPRTQHTATTLSDGRVLIVGGYTGRDVDATGVEIFNPANLSLRSSGSLNLARHDHSATLLQDGRVLVMAGYAGTWLSSGEIYNPATGQWSLTQPIYAHGVQHTATLLNDGRVLVIGGANRSGTAGPDDRVEIFDPGTNTWRAAAPHLNTEASHTATLLSDGRVLVAGGNADPAIYDPGSDTWQLAGELNSDRIFAKAVRLTDGRVLLIGGWSVNEDRALNSVEIYNPARNTWRQVEPMGWARQRHTATLLSDGRVLVTGGARLHDSQWNDPAAILDSVEIYDPSRDVWYSLPLMQQARAEHAAALLPDGRVIVTGGYAAGYTILDSIEIISIPRR